MPCPTRMKNILLQGLLWLCFLKFGFVYSAIEPGYLDFDNLPDTNFSCVGKVIGGYYADLETNCQMFHVCTIGQLDEPMDIRFLCLNGTVFDQETRVCERVDEVDCTKSEKFYHLNLELYGNTAPPIVEEPEGTDAPKLSSTSTTTTTRPTTTTRATRATFYTTAIPTLPSTTHSTPKVITSNQFPVHSGPDIRFNPEEINIRLTPGSPPIIKAPSVSFQQQAFNGGDPRITVTTHSTVFRDDRTLKPSPSSSTPKPKSVVSYGLQHTKQNDHYLPYDYSYQHTEDADDDYHTDLPSSEYTDLEHFDSKNSNSNKQVYSASTTKRTNSSPSYGSSTAYPQPLKHQFNYQRTEKPQLQLPLPVFPTLPPLTFSSPAPFSLTRHFETKRSNDRQQRPRIIISASASVSDASGRKLNYSLGTIGTHIFGKAPRSYDDYKEDDVNFDPFYLDVPKVNKPRRKRDVEETNLEENIAKTETPTEETTHWIPPEYVDDNYEPLTYQNPDNLTKSETNNSIPNNQNATSGTEYEYYEYVDDNYERANFETPNTTELNHKNEPTVTVNPEFATESSQNTIQKITVEFDSPTELIKNEEISTTEPETILITEINTTSAPISPEITTHYHEEEKTTTEFNPEEIVTEITTESNIHNEQVTDDLQNIEKLTTQVAQTEFSNYVTVTPTTENSDSVTTDVSAVETTTNFAFDQHEINYTTLSSLSEEYQKFENLITTQTPSSLIPETTTQSTFDPVTDNIKTTLEAASTELPTTTELYITAENEFEDVEKAVTTEFSTLLEKLEDSKITTSILKEEIQDAITEPTIISEQTSKIDRITMDEEINKTDQVTIITPTETTPEIFITIPMTTTSTTTELPTTTNRYSSIRSRDPNYNRRYSRNRNRPTTRHRFSSPTIHMSQSLLKLQENKRTDSVTQEDKIQSHPNKEINFQINRRFNKVGSDAQLEVITNLPEKHEDQTSEPIQDDEVKFDVNDRSNKIVSEVTTSPTAEKNVESALNLPSTKEVNFHLNRRFNKINPDLVSKSESRTKTKMADLVTIEPIDKEVTFQLNRRGNKINKDSSPIMFDDLPITDAPLSKSANPTEPKSSRSLPTTPITKTFFIPRRFTYDVTRSFNCFGKEMNKFYEDPRDCRLFHYCTPGYSDTQVLDMKFVCDYGTYFDSDKLICTKIKPQRCK